MFYAEPKKRIQLELSPDTVGEYLLDGKLCPLHADMLQARFLLFGPLDHYFAADADKPVCRIDTGAPLSVIPRRYWQPHDVAKRIDWLPTKDSRHITGVGGATIPTRLGRVELWLLDVDGRRRLIQWVIAECAFDGQGDVEELPHALYGLGGDAMKNGGLCLNYADRLAFLVKVSPSRTFWQRCKSRAKRLWTLLFTPASSRRRFHTRRPGGGRGLASGK